MTGNEVIKVASLHPKTVENHQQHLRKFPRQGGKRTPIRVLKVDTRVWKTAKRLSQGDPRRIEIISQTEVIVHNPR